jgi:hypothetical protein
MLGKLMKYEFKSTARIYLPLYGALLIVSILNRLFTYLGLKAPMFIGGGISAMMAVAIGVVTFILTLQRFNKNLLGNEGYLMFTLPVKPDSLIISKLLVAAVWFIASLFVVVLAIMIMALTDFDLKEVFEGIAEMFTMMNVDILNKLMVGIEMILFCVFCLLVTILFIYTCLSLSLLFNKHRLLVAFGAFVAISTIGQILAVIAANIASAMNLGELFRQASDMTQAHIIMIFVLLAELIIGAVFYITTRYMLTRRLNLE